jgi:YD repeat-containing protein
MDVSPNDGADDRLASLTDDVGSTTFVYDAFGRRRIRMEALWLNSAWVTNEVVRYVYDRMLVLQERDGNNLPLVTYTRGRDLSAGQAGVSGSLQGAGGIGGLLASSRPSALSIHTFRATPVAT